MRVDRYLVQMGLLGMALGIGGGGCGSGDKGCNNNGDCKNALVCVDGSCVENTLPGPGDTDPVTTDTGSGNGKDTQSSGDTNTADTGGNTDTGSGTSSGGTDTMPVCTRNADCDDGSECTFDSCDPNSFTCLYTALADGTLCGAGTSGAFCDGPARCQAGVCVNMPPCDDQAINPFSCEELVPFCNEATRSCELISNGPKPNGTVCSESRFCLGGATKTCMNGVCDDPASVPDVCGAANSDCAMALCVETTDSCLAQPVHTGDPCIDGDPCREGLCDAAGQCDWTNPCEKNPFNPCLDEFCLATGDARGDYTCGSDMAPNDLTCTKYNDPCVDGTNSGVGYCWQTGSQVDCIPSDDRICYDVDPTMGPTLCGPIYRCNNALNPNFCQLVADGTTDTNAISYEVNCNETVQFQNTHFLSRHYYNYGVQPSCTGGDYRGMELVVRLASAEFSDGPVNATFTVGNDTPDEQFEMLWLSNVCDAKSCMAGDVDMLNLNGMQDKDVVVIEAEPGYPPNSLELTITCN